jgi:hypothetical protein
MPWIGGVMGGINDCELAQKNYRRKDQNLGDHQFCNGFFVS